MLKGRKYIESLSSYARQFLKRMDKPNVDLIEGLSPAIAVDQKRNNKNIRSTVGTLSEVYDYLKLLYSNIGITLSPVSGDIVKKDSNEDVWKYLSKAGDNRNIISQLRNFLKKDFTRDLEVLLGKGYTRVIVGNEFYTIESLLSSNKFEKSYEVLVDRGFVVVGDENFKFKIFDVCRKLFLKEMVKFVSIESEKKNFQIDLN